MGYNGARTVCKQIKSKWSRKEIDNQTAQALKIYDDLYTAEIFHFKHFFTLFLNFIDTKVFKKFPTVDHDRYNTLLQAVRVSFYFKI